MKAVAYACLLILTMSQAWAFIPSKGLQHMGVNTHIRDLCIHETRVNKLCPRRSISHCARNPFKCPTDVQSHRMIYKAQLSDSSAESKLSVGRRELLQAFFLTAAASSFAGPKYSAAEVDNGADRVSKPCHDFRRHYDITD